MPETGVAGPGRGQRPEGSTAAQPQYAGEGRQVKITVIVKLV